MERLSIVKIMSKLNLEISNLFGWRNSPRRLALATLRASMIEAVLVIFLLVVAAALPMLFGNRSVVVMSGSMEPTIPTGAAVVAAPIRSSEVQRGDVLVFATGQEGALPRVHRVVRVKHSSGATVITTRGDANTANDAEKVTLAPTSWRVAYSVPFAGYVISFASRPFGTFSLVILPLVLLTILAALDWLNKHRQKLVPSHSA